MKVNFVLQRFTFAALSLIALATAFPTQALAQSAGKTGTTIVFDKSTSHALYGSNASGSDATTQYFAYLRHDITHVQMMCSNNSTLGTNGAGTFAENNNDMLFESNGYLSATTGNSSQYVYLSIIAPKGYRFTRYQWEVDKAVISSTKAEISNASIAQYTYNGSEVSLTNNSLSITSDLQNWDVTLNQGSNILYFRVDMGSTTQSRVYIKSLKLTYVLDQPFESQLPGTDLSDNIHTGLLDLGKISNNKNAFPDANGGNGYISFGANTSATDLQTVNFYQGSNGTVEKASNVAVKVDDDQYYVAASNGEYYVEAPKKFRIIGAKLNFLKKDVEGTTYTYGDVSSPTNGGTYILSDGNGHYLNLNGSSIVTGTDPKTATEWTITKSRNNYYIKSGSYYLIVNWSWNNSSYTYTLATSSSSSSSWRWSSGDGFYNYSYTRYLVYSNNTWTLSSTSQSDANKLQTRTETTGVSFTAGDFTATPYTRDNQENSANAKELNDDNTSDVIDLSDYNNDAIHFNISGLKEGEVALYNVSLMLLPLNPELQHLSVASKVGDDEVHPNTTSFSSENFEFNDKANVTVIVLETEKGKPCTVVFQNAHNEDGTKWYDKGGNENDPTQGNYSNYFLVNSSADNGGSNAVNLNINATPVPDARTSATKAGTAQLFATNIEKVATGEADHLEDNTFDKVAAKYDNATLTPDGEAKTYYIYTADMPTWNILPTSAKGEKHIDFRYYTLNVICKVVKEEPVVTIVPIYKSTLKSQNHKNTSIAANGNNLDTETTFFGVKVGYKLAQGSAGEAEGNLLSKDVVEAIDVAINDAVNNGTISIQEGDARRGMLYLDLSSLKSVDYTYFDDKFHNSVADNCLYFMYKGFSRDKIENAIAIKDNGTYEAVSNIRIYDQQPFFSPYDFTTGTYTVTYEREGTSTVSGSTKAFVKDMSVVLPFDVQLDGKGHLKTASDATDESITYHVITGSGELTRVSTEESHQELTYGVKATEVDADKAEANKPYYVTTAEEKGFTYVITGTSFKKTGTVNGTQVTMGDLTNTVGTWTGIGSYSGDQISKAANRWYFSKNLFWKSGQLSGDHFNSRPFRAYFDTTDNTNANNAKVVFNDSDIMPTGISGVTTGSELIISASHGTITLKAQADAAYAIYTVAGQTVAKGLLTQGESRSVSVAQGVYIVNNQKIIVK